MEELVVFAKGTLTITINDLGKSKEFSEVISKVVNLPMRELRQDSDEDIGTAIQRFLTYNFRFHFIDKDGTPDQDVIDAYVVFDMINRIN